MARSENWVGCPTCQTRNQPGHRFCIACGSPLPAAPRPEPAAAPKPAVTPVMGPSPGSSTIAMRPRPTTAPDGVAAAAVAAQRSSDPQLAQRTPDPLVAAPMVPIAEPAAKAKATVACPRCRTVSDSALLYCQVCGQSLSARPEAPRAEAPRAEAPRAEAPRAEAPRMEAPRTEPPRAELPRASAPAGAGQTDAFLPVGGKARGKLVQLAKDGSDGAIFMIATDQFDIGSKEGAVLLTDDPYVSGRHARLIREGGQWYVVDLGSVNGVYLKVRGRHTLADGDLILLGQQVLRFEAVKEAEQALRPAIQHGVALFGTPQMPRLARLCQRSVEGVTRDVYHVSRPEVSLGRETADIVFSDDPFLSRRHAYIRHEGGAAHVEDNGSSNGTFVAIRGRERLESGEVIRIGLHLFRVELSDNEQGGHS